MPLRRTCERRKNPPVETEPSFCISLAFVIDRIDQRMKELNLSARFSFDPQLLTNAVLNHLFYGTIARGDKYYRVKSELELLNVPTDIVDELYTTTYNWIKTQIENCVGRSVNYTAYGFMHMNSTDILILPMPLHSVPRYPVYD
jgi:hypothetical protein